MSTKPVSSYIFIITIIFILSIANGYFFAVRNPGEARQMVDTLFSQLGFVRDFSAFQVFILILLNNTIKAFLAMLLGFFFGIVPILFIFANGNVIGAIVTVLGMREGFLTISLGLLPHGIFEIPAVLIASGYGLWLGVKFYRKLRYSEPMKEAFKLAIKKYFQIVFPLLLLAAIIETFLTARLV